MKKIALILGVALLLCGACACSPAAPAQSVQATAAPAAEPAATPAQAAPEAVPEAVLEPITGIEESYAVLAPISAGELDALRQGGARCAVYFAGKQNSESETKILANLHRLTEHYAEDFLCDLYTIPVADYPAAKDALSGNLFGIVLYEGDGTSKVLCGDSRNNAHEAFNSFFENELVAFDDHGLMVIDYPALEEKIKAGETMLIYVGRDTCHSCRSFTPVLESALEESQFATPVYYFYTQAYNTAITRGADGAQETWDAIKTALGIQGTPALLYYNNSDAGVLFGEYTRLDPEDETNTPEAIEEDRADCFGHLLRWFGENGIA